MIYQTVMVDPPKAQTWLQKGGKNRSLNIKHVKRLAVLMQEGRWVLNGQTISFSADGKLLDGQHRLNAVIESGVTVPMSVSYGVEDERAFETYDVTSLKRGADQIARMDGIKDATSAVSIARRLCAWENTKNKEEFRLTNQKYADINNHDVLDYLRSNLAEIENMLPSVRSALPYKRCGAGSAFVAALILCNRVDDVATMLFVEGLKTGAGLTENSPIHRLRERLIDPPQRRGLAWETEVMALTIKSFNKYANDKPIKYLRWIQGGDTPETFPVPGGK